MTVWDAFRRRDESAVWQFLLDNRLPIDVRDPVTGFTLLHFAVYTGMRDVVEFLLRLGVDVNATDDEGLTPLYYAVDHQDDEITELLLEHGADPNKGSASPLSAAEYRKNDLLVQLLLSYGAVK